MIEIKREYGLEISRSIDVEEKNLRFSVRYSRSESSTVESIFLCKNLNVQTKEKDT
jgi:hypothetical protein